MGDRLLVRVYKAGFGECIYLRIPDQGKEFHVLIDCGSKKGTSKLNASIKDLEKYLLAETGKLELDLLVVTHPHSDHISGFSNKFFTKGVKAANVWLSPAFLIDEDETGSDNPEVTALRSNLVEFKAFQQSIQQGFRALLSREIEPGAKAQIEEMLAMTETAEKTLKTLKNLLPKGKDPLYVTANTNISALNLFNSNDIKLKVLAPVQEIDKYYLGGKGHVNLDKSVAPNEAIQRYDMLFQSFAVSDAKYPTNISRQDFERLQNRVYANLKAAAEISGHIINNLSVVLLLEWHGKRLLFPGDAEFEDGNNGKVRENAANGAWNVMWENKKAELSERLDFLKISHHGSITATPWVPKHPENEMSKVFEKILPAEEPKGFAAVSLEFTEQHRSIPDMNMLKLIGSRLCAESCSVYAGEALPQPKRTDLERDKENNPVPYLDFEFLP